MGRMVELMRAKIEKFKKLSVDDILIGVVYLFVALLPLTYWGTIEVGFTIKLSEVVIVLGFLLWVVLRFRRRDFSWRKTPLDIPLLGFWAIAGLSLIKAVNLERGIAWWLWLSLYVFGVYYFITNVIKEERHVRALLKTHIIVATVVAVFAIYQFFADWMDLPFTLMRPGYSKFGSLAYPRPHATLKEPLLLGFYLLAPAIFLATSFLSKKTLFFRAWVEGVLLFLFSVVIIITLSRGTVAALGGAFLLLGLGYLSFRLFRAKDFSKVFSPIWPRFFAFVAVVVLSFPAFLGMTKLGLYLEEVWETSNERIDDKRARAVAETSRLSLNDPRYKDWESAWRMFNENLILGVGWGNYGPTKLGVLEGIVGADTVIVNNEPLEVAVETGVVGLIFYLGFNAVFAWAMVFGFLKSIKTKLYAWAPVFAGFLLAFLAMSAQFLTFSTIQIGHFWFVLGLGIALRLVQERGKDG